MNDADDQDANRINDWSSGLNENLMMVNKVHDGGDQLSVAQKETESWWSHAPDRALKLCASGLPEQVLPFITTAITLTYKFFVLPLTEFGSPQRYNFYKDGYQQQD